MHPFVQKIGVDQAVDAEEMHLVDGGAQQHKDGQINGVIGPSQPRHIALGVGVQEEHLHQRPKRDRKEERPQEVVDVLAFEPENVRWLVARKLAVVFKAGALLALDIPKQLDPAIKHKDGRCIH